MNSRDFWVSDIHRLRLATRAGPPVHLRGICSGCAAAIVVRCYELAARTLGWAASTSLGWLGPIELLSHRLVELAWFPDDDVVSQFNVGGTRERGCALDGCRAPCQDRRLRHIPTVAEFWNPLPAFVSVVWAPPLHLIVLLPIPPPSCPPTVPLLPLRILSSQMPPTATLSPGIHLRRYHGESLSKKGTYLMK